MRITALETILTNGGLRNYLFVRLTAENGMTGVGEATLEWQERTVECVLHEWVKGRILGADVRDLSAAIDELIRDQYQGGSTIMTAISGVEIALWDLLGKLEGKPVWELLGGKRRETLPSYGNGWYGGAVSPADYADRARAAVGRGFTALKFDPFGTAWQDLDRSALDAAEGLVAGVRTAVGDAVGIMIEGHGRLNAESAIAIGQRLERYRPRWFEEPVPPLALGSLRQVRAQLSTPITAGERLYSFDEFQHLIELEAVDVINLDIAHCGGFTVAGRVARLAQERRLVLAPHCSIGPVALCAALHFGWATENVLIQEDFSSWDVPWRSRLVHGWNLATAGGFALPAGPGLGIDLDLAACAEHPYRANAFPSLWDRSWTSEFTQDLARH